MKLKIFTILFASALALSSCEKIKEALEFKDVTVPTSVEVSMPLAGIEGEKVESSPIFNLEMDIKKEVGSLDKLKEAKLESFKIERKNTGFPTLKVIKDADIYLSSTDFPAQKIASVRDNTNADKINFEVIKDVDLVNFIKSENKKFSLKNIVIGETSTSTTKVPLSIDIEWKVTVGL